MNTTIFAVWFAGLLVITFVAGCQLGAVHATKKGRTHAHARKR